MLARPLFLTRAGLSRRKAFVLGGAMLLFVGLGNPGKTYAGNRHNIGSMAIDAIAREYSRPRFRTKFQGHVSEIALAGERITLLKPQTYVNDSGRSVAEAGALSQDRAAANCDFTTNSISLRPRSGSKPAAATPAITASNRSPLISATNTGAFAWALAIRAIGRSCIITCSAISPNPRRPGFRLCAKRSPPMPSFSPKAKTTPSRRRFFASWRPPGLG